MKFFKNVLLVLSATFLFTGNPSTGFLFARGAFAGTCTTKVNGRAPINSASHAGKEYPISAALKTKYNVTGVAFSAAGFPNFKPFAIKTVTPAGLTGDRTKDNALANKAAGYNIQPAGTVWHHVEDCVTMQLLPKDIHGAARHTGGAAIILSGGNITVDATTENNDDGD
jgi:A nuclease of the HNH/ENDO VII superfamily with conserved WHH